MSKSYSAEIQQDVTITEKDYWHVLGLNQDPFVDTDELAYYPVYQWESHLELLTHLTQYSQALVGVVGEKSVGKTTFIREFDEKIAPSISRSVITTALHGFDEKALVNGLLNLLMDEPELADSDNYSVDALVEKVLSKGEPALLIIDDADKISEEMIEKLFELASYSIDETSHLHVILTGTSVIRARLGKVARLNDAEKSLHIIELSPLDEEQTVDYMQHCLMQAGLESGSLFTKNDFKRCFKLTEGFIGRVNEFAGQTLSQKLPQTEDNTPKRSSFDLSQLKIGVGVLVLIAGMFTFYQILSGGKDIEVSESEALSIPQVVSDTKTKESKISDTHAIEEKVSRDLLKSQEKTVDSKKTNNKINDYSQFEQADMDEYIPPLLLQDKTSSYNVTNLEDKITNALKSEVSQSAQMKSARSGRYSKGVSRNANGGEAGKSVTQALKASNAPRVQSAPQVIAQTVKAPKAKVLASKIKPKAKPISQKKITKAVQVKTPLPSLATMPGAKSNNPLRRATVTTPPKRYLFDERVLLDRIGSKYTIQLLASHHIDAIKAFIKKHELLGQVHYYKTSHQQKPWYVVVYGDYATRKEASASITQLPVTLKKYKPWPKQNKSIQKAIHEERA